MSGINTYFKVIFSENNFRSAAGIFKLSESDLSKAKPVWEDLAVSGENANEKEQRSI